MRTDAEGSKDSHSGQRRLRRLPGGAGSRLDLGVAGLAAMESNLPRRDCQGTDTNLRENKTS
ncbi:hypothetical protein NicSoilC12_20110 [Arthrobacter sp. NicSoilC12]|nr:hypothetical protein NicSoilC12_20110 [Arthrobacter sp. NicSoilC12]